MRWIASAVVVVRVLPAAGEPGSPPREVPLSPHVEYLGRFGYKVTDGEPDPLRLRTTAGGVILADKPVEITDDDLKTIVPKYCDGHRRVSIVIGVMEPDTTTLRTISGTIERVNKQVPAKTVVTFLIMDYD